MRLSDSQIRQFHEDGALAVRGAFADRVDLLRAGVERNIAEPGPFATDSVTGGEPGRFFDDYCNWERIPEYRQFAADSECAALAGQAMQAREARLFHEHIVIKEPGTTKATPWHHDMPYYCVDGGQTVSIWIALDPVPAEATVRFVAGSHRWGKLFYPRKFLDGRNYVQDADSLEEVPDIDGNPDGYRILSWACEPGDAVLFDFRTLHGTTAARLENRRRAIAFRWMGEDAIYCDRHGETSPPYPELKNRLTHGDPLPDDVFPVMWRQP